MLKSYNIAEDKLIDGGEVIVYKEAGYHEDCYAVHIYYKTTGLHEILWLTALKTFYLET